MRATSKGFTLIECMMTIVVLVLVMGIGLPALTGTLRAIEARSGAADLQTAFATARMQAIAGRVPVAVCPSDDGVRCRSDGIWGGGWIAFRDAARDGRPVSASSVIRYWRPAEGVHAHSSAGRPLVRFLPNGAASGTNLTVTLCAGSAIQQIVVNNAGRARRESHPPSRCS